MRLSRVTAIRGVWGTGSLLPLAASDRSSVVRVEAIRPFPEKVISGRRRDRDLHSGMEASQRPGPSKE